MQKFGNPMARNKSETEDTATPLDPRKEAMKRRMKRLSKEKSDISESNKSGY